MCCGSTVSQISCSSSLGFLFRAVEGIEKSKMSLVKSVYNALFRRTSSYALVVVVGAFFFERAFDTVTENIFDSINQGKQWKDIKSKYETSE